MAKQIKHIRAGLLHIEVIGTVPTGIPTANRRGQRQTATALAQQFYNLKLSWRTLELAIATNFTARDMVLTFTYDDANLPQDKIKANQLIQKFLRRLRTVRKRRSEELRYIYVTEGFHAKCISDFLSADGDLEDTRIHHHMVMNAIGFDDLSEIKSLWQYGGYIRAEPLDIHYVQELAKYMTKEAREFGSPKSGDRTWRASKNLIKYEVEYIDIPSDSVTLTAPPGAVDYVQFSEKNPYGYADCIGSRYLLYDTPSPPRYSYTQGRANARQPK